LIKIGGLDAQYDDVAGAVAGAVDSSFAPQVAQLAVDAVKSVDITGVLSGEIVEAVVTGVGGNSITAASILQKTAKESRISLVLQAIVTAAYDNADNNNEAAIIGAAISKFKTFGNGTLAQDMIDAAKAASTADVAIDAAGDAVEAVRTAANAAAAVTAVDTLISGDSANALGYVVGASWANTGKVADFSNLGVHYLPVSTVSIVTNAARTVPSKADKIASGAILQLVLDAQASQTVAIAQAVTGEAPAYIDKTISAILKVKNGATLIVTGVDRTTIVTDAAANHADQAGRIGYGVALGGADDQERADLGAAAINAKEKEITHFRREKERR
jgi:hypothetical protein